MTKFISSLSNGSSPITTNCPASPVRTRRHSRQELAIYLGPLARCRLAVKLGQSGLFSGEEGQTRYAWDWLVVCRDGGFWAES